MFIPTMVVVTVIRALGGQTCSAHLQWAASFCPKGAAFKSILGANLILYF